MSLARSDIVRVLNGSVRVSSTTTYDAQIAESERDGEFGTFDPRFKAEYEGSQIDEPPSSFFGPGIETETRRDETEFSAELSRKWQTGTTTSLGYAPPLAYLYFPRGVSGELNPAYSSEFLLKVEQPLLRGAWKDINLAPIRIAQTRVDQSRWDVQQSLQQQVRSVEEAYWQLNAALVELQAVQNVIPLAEESVRIEKLRMQAEQSIYSDVARAEVQLEDLRQQYMDAWLIARRREFQLRQLIGMQAKDGRELMPADAPRQTGPMFDFDDVVSVALQERPDLHRRRLGLEIREHQLLVAQNAVKPQFNVSAAWRVSGLSNQIDQAFDQVGGFDYEDWTLGLSFDTPIGNRRARSQQDVRALQLMKERALLQAFEKQVVFDLAELSSEVIAAWRQYESAHRQLVHTAQWLRVARVRYSNPPDAGDSRDWLLLSLRDYQTAMDSHVSAVSRAGRALARYNVLLARLSEQQGTNLERWSIQLDGTNFRAPADGIMAGPGYAPLPGQSFGGEYVSGGIDTEPLVHATRLVPSTRADAAATGVPVVSGQTPPVAMPPPPTAIPQLPTQSTSLMPGHSSFAPPRR